MTYPRTPDLVQLFEHAYDGRTILRHGNDCYDVTGRLAGSFTGDVAALAAGQLDAPAIPDPVFAEPATAADWRCRVVLLDGHIQGGWHTYGAGAAVTTYINNAPPAPVPDAPAQ